MPDFAHTKGIFFFFPEQLTTSESLLTAEINTAGRTTLTGFPLLLMNSNS